MRKIDRTGEEIIIDGEIITIVEYIDANRCTIQFEDSTIAKCTYRNFKNKSIRNPNKPVNNSIGYVGIGKYKSKESGKRTPFYVRWSSMFTRCYNEKYQEKFPTYIGCTVDERWHNFQNFAEWCEKHYTFDFILDKDILIKGNKIYSPETCCLVPQEINKLLTKNNINRGKYPIGVTFNKSKKKFEANLSKGVYSIYLGVFDTKEKAFQAYKEAKELWVKEVANRWCGQITEECYLALINYQVEITD